MHSAIPTFGLPVWFLCGAAFAFGAVLGSFLNVVIARVPLGESIAWPGSHCRACGAPVRALDNIPILSWLFLRGRCRECQSPFSVRYALVELGFALVCALAVARQGISVEAAREVLLMAFLIALTGTDLDHWLLPHEITRSGIAVGLLLGAAEGKDAFLFRLLAAALGYTALALVGFAGERILKKEAIGGGDPWLFALIGGFLGPRALPAVLMLASLQGTLIGLAMLAARRRSPASEPAEAPGGREVEAAAAAEPAAPSGALPESRDAGAGEGEDEWKPDPHAIPFGPFLALGAAEALYFAQLPRMLFPWPF